MAEARGVTTLAVLLQLTHRYYARTRITVRCASVDELLPEDRAQATRRLEQEARALVTSRQGH
jgi:hypothetical protein